MKVVILALQLKEYTHFLTNSRYPDLVIHRILKSILLNTEVVYTQNLLEDQCAELSELEKTSKFSASHSTIDCYHLEKKLEKHLIQK